MTEPRHTADTVTDDALDELYAGLEQAQTRAEQAEDLLRIAHETSNRAEAERASAVRRAEQAEGALARVRAAVHIADDEDVTDWQRGFRACSVAVLGTLDQPGPAATDTTARVFAALHRSAEQNVSRVIDLYERWLAAGPPPLGTSVSRWWDARLAELHDAILPPTT
ncbi:hypothetical protein C9F11_37515 [Streptomyces sp. YIM 121038]|uniref:hypothetical protein n=1 Tax=Streptomyces sp. YIM 121038 TaxID=2136401 RepID=UPI0011102CC3|nr:hypothetical protein [Streptomyces sp. YIM 121038]QCX81086.1 hypothetical protein C9F11_37515 [Streptomyces sp. YIM 121038]